MWTSGAARCRGPSRCGARSFFFQAEDGIRDRNVTGVQTCALPISCRAARREGGEQREDDEAEVAALLGGIAAGEVRRDVAGERRPERGQDGGDDEVERVGRVVAQIGRASCRERVWR